MGSHEAATTHEPTQTEKMHSSEKLTESESGDALQMKSLENSSLENGVTAAPGDQSQVDAEFNYIHGWRLHAATISLGLALFLVNFEITIVSTALVSIADDLHGYSKESWVVTAYLITYTAGLVIVAKLSDHFGRKNVYLATLLFFAAFSGGCGGAQTMVQLIIFRAFQGLGGGGVYAVALVMLYELVPKTKYPLYTAISTCLVALGNALGPIFGGLIADGTTWRWVFLLNIPASALIAALVLFTVPGNFPYQGLDPQKQRPRTQLKEIDFTGAFLMLLAFALLIAGFENAASLLSWTSASFIALVVVSAFVWVVFFASQWWFTSRQTVVQPIFPWRFAQSRMMTGLLLNSFFTGAVSITCIIQFPIRYQTTIGVNPFEAGVRLLAFSFFGPFGAILIAVLCGKRRLPPLYVGLFGVLIQIIGLVFVSMAPRDTPDWKPLYGLQVIVGLGMGCNIGLVALLTPFVVERRDLAVASAAGTQFRFLGSAIVVSLTTAVGNGWIRDTLSDTLTPAQIQGIFRSTATINDLPADLERQVRRDFVTSFNLEMHIVLGFAVASLFSIALLWRKNQIRVD
ncbi:drug resistance transporter [Xylariaceae sp. FL1019]|nr:drug resistance transporter [Xylariaceae sp. FL1019]